MSFHVFAILLPIPKKFLGLKNHKTFGRAENIILKSKNSSDLDSWAEVDSAVF
jgi:hypothetical protein